MTSSQPTFKSWCPKTSILWLDCEMWPKSHGVIPEYGPLITSITLHPHQMPPVLSCLRVSEDTTGAGLPSDVLFVLSHVGCCRPSESSSESPLNLQTCLQSVNEHMAAFLYQKKQISYEEIFFKCSGKCCAMGSKQWLDLDKYAHYLCIKGLFCGFDSVCSNLLLI